MASLEFSSLPLVTWWQPHPKTEQCVCGHQPCRITPEIMAILFIAVKIFLKLSGKWSSYICNKAPPKFISLFLKYVLGKESRPFSKLTPQLFAASLSPMMVIDWWQHLMTSLSKCGAFTVSASSTHWISTQTGFAVPGTVQHDTCQRLIFICKILIIWGIQTFDVLSLELSKILLRMWSCQSFGHFVCHRP